jgi:hypothetical protein
MGDKKENYLGHVHHETIDTDDLLEIRGAQNRRFEPVEAAGHPPVPTYGTRGARRPLAALPYLTRDHCWSSSGVALQIVRLRVPRSADCHVPPDHRVHHVYLHVHRVGKRIVGVHVFYNREPYDGMHL